MTVILDYGMGNLRSVQKACELLGCMPKVQSNLAGATKLIIPGVGAFGAAMERIGPLAEEIRAFASTGNPLLGICLGQQLLFDSSEELGEFSGLGLVPGRVKYLPGDRGFKVPHIGWSGLHYCRLEGIAKEGVEGEQVYFVHSLYTECRDADDVVAIADCGVPFPAAIRRDNVWGVQFHPEKSGKVGLRMLKAFLSC